MGAFFTTTHVLIRRPCSTSYILPRVPRRTNLFLHAFNRLLSRWPTPTRVPTAASDTALPATWPVTDRATSKRLATRRRRRHPPTTWTNKVGNVLIVTRPTSRCPLSTCTSEPTTRAASVHTAVKSSVARGCCRATWGLTQEKNLSGSRGKRLFFFVKLRVFNVS